MPVGFPRKPLLEVPENLHRSRARPWEYRHNTLFLNVFSWLQPWIGDVPKIYTIHEGSSEIRITSSCFA